MSLSSASPAVRSLTSSVSTTDPAPTRAVAASAAVAFDSLAFRRTLGRFATGVTVVTMEADGHDDLVLGAGPYGITVNAFMSLSLDPPLIAVSIDKKAGAHATLMSATRFGVSVLAADQTAVSDHFAGRQVTLGGDPFTALAGFPVIAGSVARLVSRVNRTVDVGDHTLFIGEVEAIERDDDAPLVFFGGQYRELR